MTTMITDIYMTAKIAAPAVLDVKHHRVLFARELLGPAIGFSVIAENVGHLQLCSHWTLTGPFSFCNRRLALIKRFAQRPSNMISPSSQMTTLKMPSKYSSTVSDTSSFLPYLSAAASARSLE